MIATRGNKDSFPRHKTNRKQSRVTRTGDGKERGGERKRRVLIGSFLYFSQFEPVVRRKKKMSLGVRKDVHALCRRQTKSRPFVDKDLDKGRDGVECY